MGRPTFRLRRGRRSRLPSRGRRPCLTPRRPRVYHDAKDRRPKRAAGDMAYNNKRIRGWLRSRRMGAVIPRPKNQRRRRFDKVRYKGRNVVERLIGWLKERRRLATRFELLRYVWDPALFVFAVYIIVLSSIVLVAAG